MTRDSFLLDIAREAAALASIAGFTAVTILWLRLLTGGF